MADIDELELERVAGDFGDTSAKLSTFASKLFGAAARIVALTIEDDDQRPSGAPVRAATAAARRLREVLAARLPELQRELANLETAIADLERAAPS